MRSYKLLIDDSISYFLKIDIRKLLETKIKLKSQENAAITYTVTLQNSIPIIIKETKIYDDKVVIDNILCQESFWNQSLYYIEKTPKTIIIPSSYLFTDIALDISNKLQCYNNYNVEPNIYDNIVIIGGEYLNQLSHLKDLNPESNLEVFTLNPYIDDDKIWKYDKINILTSYVPVILTQYGNVISLDASNVIVDCIISDFYNI